MELKERFKSILIENSFDVTDFKFRYIKNRKDFIYVYKKSKISFSEVFVKIFPICLSSLDSESFIKEIILQLEFDYGCKKINKGKNGSN